MYRLVLFVSCIGYAVALRLTRTGGGQGAFEALARGGRGDGDHSLGAFGQGAAAEVGGGVLGDDDAGFAKGGGDGAGEGGDDARGGGEGGGEGDEWVVRGG